MKNEELPTKWKMHQDRKYFLELSENEYITYPNLQEKRKLF